MPNACLVCLRSSKSHPGLSFHKFPTNPVMRGDWLKICGFSESDYGPHRRLCSRHFEDNCFTGNVKRYLKPKSIPTLHLKYSEQLSFNTPESLDGSVPYTNNSKHQSLSEPNIATASSLQRSKELTKPGHSQILKFSSEMVNSYAVGGLKCALNYCKSCYVKCYDNDKVSFFGFPKDSARCAIWVEKCNAKYLPTTDLTDLSKNYKLCSLHFEDKMFANFQKNRLFAHAIPSLFQNDPVTPPPKFIIIIQNDSENKIDKRLKDSVPRDHNYCNSKKQKSKLIDCNPSVEKGIILVKDKDYLGVKRIRTEKMNKTLNDPVLREHNYCNSSIEKNKTNPDKDNPEAKQTCTVAMDDIVEIAIKKQVVEQEDSLFVRLKAQTDLITLPKNWFCDVSGDSIPITITFFTLNNSSITSKRYLEKQLVVDQDSKITFFVNGNDLIPSNFGLMNYCKPSDIISLQKVIQEFDNINICQGISKKYLKNIRLNVFEYTNRWWHPKCTHNLADKKSFLCYSCKILNNVILKMSGKKIFLHQKPLDNTIHQKKKSTKLKSNVKKNTSVKVSKMSKIISTLGEP